MRSLDTATGCSRQPRGVTMPYAAKNLTLSFTLLATTAIESCHRPFRTIPESQASAIAGPKLLATGVCRHALPPPTTTNNKASHLAVLQGRPAHGTEALRRLSELHERGPRPGKQPRRTQRVQRVRGVEEDRHCKEVSPERGHAHPGDTTTRWQKRGHKDTKTGVEERDKQGQLAFDIVRSLCYRLRHGKDK